MALRILTYLGLLYEDLVKAGELTSAGTPIPQVRNLVTALFGLENSRTPEDVQQLLSRLIDWLALPEQMSLRRNFNRARAGRGTGREQGLQQGLQEGREEGLQQGRQQGLQEGRQEGEQNFLQRPLDDGIGAAESLHA